MQWVTGDFLAPSFKETIDELIHHGNFKYIYFKGNTEEEKKKQMAFDKKSLISLETQFIIMIMNPSFLVRTIRT